MKNKIGRKIFVYIFSFLMMYGIVDTIFRISGLTFPYPIWLAFLLCTGFMIILPDIISEVLNKIGKTNAEVNKINHLGKPSFKNRG